MNLVRIASYLSNILASSGRLDFEVLSSKKSLEDMADYCRDVNIPYINGGSARVVFDLRDGKVLKLAHTKPGVKQNKAEYQTYKEADSSVKRVVTAVDLGNHDKSYRWIVCEKVEPFGFGASDDAQRQYDIASMFLRIDPDDIDEVGRESIEELNSLTGDEAKFRDGIISLLNQGHDKDELISEMQMGVRKGPKGDELVFLDFGLDGNG